MRGFAARAETIDPADLTADEQVSRDVLMFEAQSSADDLATRQAELAANHTIGLQTMLPVVVQQLPIVTSGHAAALVNKYRAMADAITASAGRLQEGVANNRTPIASTVLKSVSQLDAYLATDLANDPYLSIAAPADMDDGAVTRWRSDLAAAVSDHIRPAWVTYRNVLADEVAPAGRPDDKPGVLWLDDGADLYATALARHTSTDRTAENIHQTGLDQIASLAEEYRTLGAEVLGTSELSDIFSRLRDDPSLRFTDGAAVVAASEAALAKAAAAMGDWFGRLPKAPCLVKETPSGPTAFYYPPAADGSRPGTFFVNTADPTRWQTFEIESMAYHEGIPGHHLQLAISTELEGVPEFRKHASVTAYAEGWGLYTERLADEMGLYSGPLERIGMLSADSMRAGRLVVDTGIHAMGWTRQQAIDVFAENSPMSMTTIENEVDRYIGMPGQACAYMVGRLEIMRMRDEARQRLGDAFDIKDFHDTVLGSGLVPLSTLDRMVRALPPR